MTAALAAKISFNDALVGLDDARGPFRELFSVIENEHGLAEPHHHFHVVFDQQHGLAAVAQGADGVEQLVR